MLDDFITVYLHQTSTARVSPAICHPSLEGCDETLGQMAGAACPIDLWPVVRPKKIRPPLQVDDPALDRSRGGLRSVSHA